MESSETIVVLANRFYEVAKLIKANKGQCEAIAKRITRLVPSRLCDPFAVLRILYPAVPHRA